MQQPLELVRPGAGRLARMALQVTPGLLHDARLRAVLTACLAVLACFNIVTTWPAGPNFYDYQGFVAAGRALGLGISPYGPAPSLPGITDQGFGIPWPQASPPPALFLFRAFSALSLATGARVWFIASLLLCCMACLSCCYDGLLGYHSARWYSRGCSHASRLRPR